MTHDTFEAFAFAEPLSRAITQCGYTTPTPVQAQALQPQLEGRDLLALAETGSGKTAAFLLPILQEFAANPINPNPREVLTLILAPTRELALQIDQEVASLTRNLHAIRRAVVLGGVSKGPQINALKRGVHVLVSTPGRLLDHVNERHADLRPVRTFVLDEADRMFDMGFIRDIRKIASMLSHKRRTAMFSATMPPEIRTLAHELLNDPYRVDLSPKQVVVDRIDQKVMVVRASEKQSRLHTILKDEACSRVIVFTRTKRGADRVTDRLGMAGIGAAAIHGNKAQNARQRALKDFSLGHVRVLVATDIAARGIDVSDVTHVINFDMPVEPETYVHRIGRTARKGTSGVAISLCDPSEKPEIAAIERLMKQPIQVIGDIGGEALAPMERRPREDSNERFGGNRRPRQEGRGHGQGRGGERQGRGPRAGGGRDRHERSDAPRPAHGAAGDSSSEKRSPRPEGRREHHHGPQGERRAHTSVRDGEIRSDNRERHGQRSHHENRGHAPAARTGERVHGSQARSERPHGAGGERAQPHRGSSRGAEHGASKGHAQGKGSWDGQRPPKFLNGAAPRRRPAGPAA